MLMFKQKTQTDKPADTTLTLSFDQRIKSRLKVTLDDGRDAGIVLHNGSSLKHNDLLQSTAENNTPIIIVQVKAAEETVSTVYCDDALQLARVCYHLGNRHVNLQIEKGFVRYQHDHVLDDMVVGLGLEVKVEQAPFEPEPGAYHHASSHSHGHHHSH